MGERDLNVVTTNAHRVVHIHVFPEDDVFPQICDSEFKGLLENLRLRNSSSAISRTRSEISAAIVEHTGSVT